ncbi:MAG: bifunctional DNA primase/polymerase, partial [Chloroflexota bacterium]|nr:bifunctional DNA primase/polymerase [Chloroflexota bacterium]
MASEGTKVHPRHWVEDGTCSCKNPGCKHLGNHDHPWAGENRASATTDQDVIRGWAESFPKIGFGTPDSPDPATAGPTRETPDDPSMKDHALAHAERGWRVFPVWWMEGGACACGKASCDRPAKHPIPATGLKSASDDPAKIDRWWTQYPKANIAVATGSASGLVVVDIDGPKGEEQVGGLEIPRTAVARSGRADGGRHVYFLHPQFPVKSDASVLGTNTKVDVRADGGYAILPPSVHETGNRYAWVESPEETGLAAAPEWVVQAANMKEDERNEAFGLGDKKRKGRGRPKKDADHATDEEDDGDEFVREGRNVWLTQKAGGFRRLGLGEAALQAAIDDVNRARCDPALPQQEVDRIVQNAMGWVPSKKIK